MLPIFNSASFSKRKDDPKWNRQQTPRTTTRQQQSAYRRNLNYENAIRTSNLQPTYGLQTPWTRPRSSMEALMDFLWCIWKTQCLSKVKCSTFISPTGAIQAVWTGRWERRVHCSEPTYGLQTPWTRPRSSMEASMDFLWCIWKTQCLSEVNCSTFISNT